MNEMSRGNDALVGFLFGAVVGAGVALLMAPATGEETRRRLGETAGKLAHNTKDKIDQVRNRLGEMGSDLKERSDHAADKFREGTENYRQGVEAFRKNPA
jgi:gas vesicle protein